MNKLYGVLGISKQGVHKIIETESKKRDEQLQLLKIIYDIREDHPTMGVRDMYYKIRPTIMGRDVFEAFCKEHKLDSKRNKNYRRTTDSSGVIRFENLIKELTLTKMDQVWQSDISYFEVKGRFYYLTFILDAYSRRIVGYQVSSRLRTEDTTLPSLRMAIRIRKGRHLVGLIFHSDGGGQYYDKVFLELTSKYKIINSMCEYAWENGKAERINGVIKNNYLKHRKIESYEMLCKEVDRAVSLYNQDKPHIKLNRKSPMTFEKELLNLQEQTKPKMNKSLEAKVSI